jgi:hypothetical protein
MKYELKASEPDSIEFELTAKLTLGEWRVIKDALTDGNWNPTTRVFADQIRDMVELANKTFYQIPTPQNL